MPAVSNFETCYGATAANSLLGSDGGDSALLLKLNQAKSASAMNDVEVV